LPNRKHLYRGIFYIGDRKIPCSFVSRAFTPNVHLTTSHMKHTLRPGMKSSSLQTVNYLFNSFVYPLSWRKSLQFCSNKFITAVILTLASFMPAMAQTNTTSLTGEIQDANVLNDARFSSLNATVSSSLIATPSSASNFAKGASTKFGQYATLLVQPRQMQF
jgi:hypothetical protein